MTTRRGFLKMARSFVQGGRCVKFVSGPQSIAQPTGDVNNPGSL